MLRSSILTLGALGMLLTGCPKQVDGPGGTKLPGWYMTPPAGCGVGTGRYQGQLQTSRNAAVSQARTDLARQMEVKIEGMIKQYAEQGTTEGEDFAESLITDVSRDIVNTTLAGTVVRNGEIMEVDGAQNFVAMVCLDPETFADAFDRMNRMSDKMRKALKERAKAEFDDLDAQIQRLDSQ